MLPPAPRRHAGPGAAARGRGRGRGRGRVRARAGVRPGPGEGEGGRAPRAALGPGARGAGETPARGRRTGARGAPGGPGAAGAAGGGDRPRAPRSRAGSWPAPVPGGGRCAAAAAAAPRRRRRRRPGGGRPHFPPRRRVCHCGPPPDGAARAMPPRRRTGPTAVTRDRGRCSSGEALGEGSGAGGGGICAGTRRGLAPLLPAPRTNPGRAPRSQLTGAATRRKWAGRRPFTKAGRPSPPLPLIGPRCAFSACDCSGSPIQCASAAATPPRGCRSCWNLPGPPRGGRRSQLAGGGRVGRKPEADLWLLLFAQICVEHCLR